MKKRILAFLLAVSLAVGTGGEAVLAAPNTESSLKGSDQERRESVQSSGTKNYGAGNSMASATPIPLKGTVQGSITETNAGDFYKITVPSSSSVRLDLKFTVYMRNARLRMYDSEGTNILDWDLDWNENTRQKTENCPMYLDPGIYYIGVTRYYDWQEHVGNYKISLSPTSLKNLDLPMDDTIGTAHAIPLTTSFTGVLADGENSDFYKLNVTAPGIINCRFTAYMRSAYIRLFDREGEELWYDRPEWNENIGYSTNTYEFPLEKGIYYLQIADGNGKYTLSNRYTNIGSNETEKNDTIQTADSLAMNRRVTGLLGLNEDSDMYRVVIPRSGNVPVYLRADMEYVYLKIYDSRGNEVVSENPYWNGSLGYSTNNYNYMLSAGTYYVQILGSYGCRGRYQLQVGRKAPKVNISKASAASIKNRIYTGKSIRPSVKVTYNGRTLKKNTDYTVSYKNNKRIGTATITITGKGNYTGTKKISFKIVPKKVNLSSVKNNGRKMITVKWKKVSSAGGYEVYRSTKRSSGYRKVKTIHGNKKVSFRNTKLKKKKTYYYKVRAYKKVGKKTYYGSFSNIKSAKIKK